MKLLYATSLTYPSLYANRIQVRAMSEAFAKILGSDFVLGILHREGDGSGNDGVDFACRIFDAGKIRKSPILAWKYARYAKKNGITHIYAREEKLVFFIKCYAKLLGLRSDIVFEAHFFRDDFAFRQAVVLSDKVVTITEGIRQELVLHGVKGEKILSAHDGVDPSRFENVSAQAEERKVWNLPSDKKILLYVGSFTRYSWKGIDVMLEAAKRAPQSWLFVLAGGHEKEINELRAEYPAPNCRFIPYVEAVKVPSLLRSADVLVIPNKKGDKASESYTSPLKLFEYMSSGVPILASRVRAIEEVLTENEGTFFEPNDPQALVDAAERILGDEDAAMRKASAARALAESTYTWERRAATIRQFIDGRAPNIAARKILVVQAAKLGDMVCTTPVFRAIKKANPDNKVFVLGISTNKSVLQGNTDIDGYIDLDKEKNLVARLREEHFDAAVITGPNASILLKLIRARIPQIVTPQIVEGDSPWSTILYRLLAHFVNTVPHRMGHYAPGEYLLLLRPLGIHATDTTKHLAFSPDAEKRATELLHDFLHASKAHEHSGHKLVGISPGAGNKIKNWPAEHFAEIADHLILKKDARIVILGSSRDREEVASMFERIKSKDKVLNLSEKMSVAELKALIADLDLFVAVDTGPIYIAEAFGVPTVDIVGPMDEREQPPIGPTHRVVLPPGRKEGTNPPELHIMNARMYNYATARSQTESITVDMVLSEIGTILG